MGGFCFSPEQQARLERYEAALAVQLAAKPKRLEHSLSVASCAEELARIYGVDPFKARVAGILHDWCKAYSDAELLELASAYGVKLEGPDEHVVGLLHGPLAAAMLPERFGELEADVLSAIEHHTLGAPDMSALDAVVFIADAIEPLRPDYPAIVRMRGHVGELSLERLLLGAMAESMRYVIETRRFLCPEALDGYNALIERLPRIEGDA